MASVKYVIGSTYNGPSWEAYMDICGGDVDLIQKVIFQINGKRQNIHYPIHVNRTGRRRFRTSKFGLISGRIKVRVTVVGRGGTVKLGISPVALRLEQRRSAVLRNFVRDEHTSH